MRIIIFLTFFSLFSTQCASKKTGINGQYSKDSIVFIYKHYTRGFYKEYHINKNTITTYLNHNKTISENQKTVPFDWTTCLRLVTDLELDSISTLESPSNLRHTDQVHFAEVTITIGQATYRSSSFDHGNPPASLKPLVDHLIYMATID